MKFLYLTAIGVLFFAHHGHTNEELATSSGLGPTFIEIVDSIENFNEIWSQLSEFMKEAMAVPSMLHMPRQVKLLIDAGAVVLMAPRIDDILNYFVTHGFPNFFPTIDDILQYIRSQLALATKVDRSEFDEDDDEEDEETKSQNDENWREKRSKMEKEGEKIFDKISLIINDPKFHQLLSKLGDADEAFEDLIYFLSSPEITRSYLSLREDAKMTDFLSILKISGDSVKFYEQLLGFEEENLSPILKDLEEETIVIRDLVKKIERNEIQLDSIDFQVRSQKMADQIWLIILMKLESNVYTSKTESMVNRKNDDVRMENGVDDDLELHKFEQYFLTVAEPLAEMTEKDDYLDNQVVDYIPFLRDHVTNRHAFIRCITSIKYTRDFDGIKFILPIEKRILLRIARQFRTRLQEISNQNYEANGYHGNDDIGKQKLDQQLSSSIEGLELEPDDIQTEFAKMDGQEVRVAIDQLLTRVDVEGLLQRWRKWRANPLELDLGWILDGLHGQKLANILIEMMAEKALKDIIDHVCQYVYPNLTQTLVNLVDLDLPVVTPGGEEKNLPEENEKNSITNQFLEYVPIFRMLEDAIDLYEEEGNVAFRNFVSFLQRRELLVAFDTFLKNYLAEPALYAAVRDRGREFFTFFHTTIKPGYWPRKFDDNFQNLRIQLLSRRWGWTESKFVESLSVINWREIWKCFEDQEELYKLIDYLTDAGFTELPDLINGFEKLVWAPSSPSLNDDYDDDTAQSIVNLFEQSQMLLADLEQVFVDGEREKTKNHLILILQDKKVATAFQNLAENQQIQKFFELVQNTGIDVKFMFKYIKKYLESNKGSGKDRSFYMKKIGPILKNLKNKN